MMLKRIVTLTGFLLIVLCTTAQYRIKQNIGTNAHLFVLNNSQRVDLFGLGYTPRYILFDLTESISINGSAPLGLGFNISNVPGFSYFLVNVPLCAEIAIGHEANNAVDFPIGVFLGAGGEYNFLTAGGLQVQNVAPVATLGVRAFIANQSFEFRIIKALSVPENGQTIRFSLLRSIDSW